MQPRTVLQIGVGWFAERRGGAENVFYNLCARLPASGFEVRGLVPGSETVSEATGHSVLSFGGNDTSTAQRTLGVRRAARAALASGRPHVVAAHFALYTLPVLDLIRDIPLVVHFHGPWGLESRVEGANPAVVAAKRLVERLVYRRARRIIVLSDAFGRILQDHYGIPGSVLRRIPGGVDSARFAVGETREEARFALGWESGRPTVLAVRRLVRRMGLGNLIQAIALLRQRHPDVLLCIAGTGAAREELEGQARAAGLQDSVRFLGSLSDAALPLAYRAADVSIVPTLALEGFGLIAVESLAAGTPVLVTPVGGLPEIVRPLSPDLVLPGTSPELIAAGLDGALSNPGLLPSDAACRRYAQAHFDWQAVAQATADVYREVA